jgi:uncharacterized protein (DUF1015 family)
MVTVDAFRGIRYNPKKVSSLESVVAPPYDVISPKEQIELYERSVYNVVRLILPKGEDESRYSEAGKTFKEWIEEKVLIQDTTPCIYPYYQEFEEGGKKVIRKGFIARVKLEDFSTQNILPHEKTFPKHKQDRLKLILACRANLSPVFAVYSDPEGILERAIDEAISSEKPIADLSNSEGVKNKLWSVSDKSIIEWVKNYMKSRRLLIADGHHRYETALEYRNLRRKESNLVSEENPYEYVMMYISRAEGEGLIIKPTHRVVKRLRIDINELLKRLTESFKVEKIPLCEYSTLNLKPQEFALLTGNSDSVFKFSVKEPLPFRYKNLGVMLLHTLVFGKIISEEESEILYTKSIEEVVSLVKSGQYELGIVLAPISAPDVFEVAMAGEKMPHKTTYFYPKLLSGLVFNPLWETHP